MAIYRTRYLAESNRHSGDRVIKVMGGYTIISARQYQISKKNRSIYYAS